MNAVEISPEARYLMAQAWTEGLLHARFHPWAKPEDNPYRAEIAPKEGGSEPEAWFCEAHRVWTTSDCPKCDDEMERVADR